MRLVIRDMVTFDLMQPAAFDTRYQTGSPKIKFSWKACPSVLDQCRNAAKHTREALGEAPHCPCFDDDLKWLPRRLGLDGKQHIVAKQGEIAWEHMEDDAAVCQLCRTICSKTRLHPTKTWMRKAIFDNLNNWITANTSHWPPMSADNLITHPMLGAYTHKRATGHLE